MAGCAALASLAFAIGCASTPPEDEVDEEEISARDATAALAIAPLDIWGQALPPQGLELRVTRDGRPVRADVARPAPIFLKEPGRYQVRLAAPLHEPAELTLDYDGSSAAGAVRLVATLPGVGAALTHRTTTSEGRTLPTHELFAGLRHQWFSAQGRPARRNNAVSLMLDGQEAWGAVHRELRGAKSSVQVATWWWESSFELVRNFDLSQSQEARWPNTILGTLEGSPARKRIIVGQFWGQDSILSWFNTDARLRAYAEQSSDAIEFMGQGNETRGTFTFAVPPFSFADRVKATRPDVAGVPFDAAPPVASSVPSHVVDLSSGAPIAQDFLDGLLETASYHQKFISIDSKVAFVGGMNLQQSDWDTSNHFVFDARRVGADASASTRMDVASSQKASPLEPRKDYMLRLEGPAVEDVDDVFQKRWELLRQGNVKFSDRTTPFVTRRNLAAAGTTQVQVTATLPAPFHEYAIAETWFNAVRNAKRTIFIEDQYFRVPMLHEAIAARMRAVPELRLVVVTMPITRTNPACAPSREAYTFFRSQFPTRTSFFQLKAFDGSGPSNLAFVDIFTHSKMLIVDDLFMSVGSANKNNRGLVYEGELNVAVVDEAVVGAARRRIVANLLGQKLEALAEDWVSALAVQAAKNDQGFRAWQSDAKTARSLAQTGFVYGLDYPRTDDCILASVGPDRT